MGGLLERAGIPEEDETPKPPTGSLLSRAGIGKRTIRNGTMGSLVGHEFIPDADSPDYGDVSIDEVVNIPNVGPFEITQKGEGDLRKVKYPASGLERMTSGVATGAVKAVAGPGQLVSGAAELLGLAPEGHFKKTGEGAETLIGQIEDATSVSEGDPVSQASSIATQAAPFMQRFPVSVAGQLVPFFSKKATELAPKAAVEAATVTKGILEGSTSGVILGGQTYVADEEQPFSSDRGWNTAISLGVGGSAPLLFGTLGKISSKVRSEEAKRQAVIGASEDDVLAAQWLQSKGYNVTPAGAMVKLAKYKQEKGLVVDDINLKFKTEELMEQNKTLVAKEVDDISKSLLPEGDEFQAIRGEWYKEAFATPVKVVKNTQLKVLQKYDDMMKRTIDNIRKNPELAPTWDAFDTNSIGQLQMVKQALDKEMAVLRKKEFVSGLEGDEAAKLASFKELRGTIRQIGVDNSPAYGKALDMSARMRVMENINKKLKALELDDINNVDPFDFYTKVLKNKQSVEEVFGDLDILKNRKIADNVTKKVEAVRKLLRKLRPHQKSLKNLSETLAPGQMERSNVQAMAFVGGKRLISGEHNEQIMEFMMNPKWTEGTIKRINALPDDKAAVAFSMFLSRIGQGGAFTYESEGQTRPQDTYREPTEEELEAHRRKDNPALDEKSFVRELRDNPLQ